MNEHSIRKPSSNRAKTRSYAFQIRGGVEVDAHGRKAGKGLLMKTEHYPCLCAMQDTTIITKTMEWR